MGEYVVVSGDTLSRIAGRHGIRFWQNIYLATENARFRSARANPDLIRPGDRIHIPDRDGIRPMERHATLVHHDVPLFTQSSETCWRATGKMLYLRRFPRSNEAEFNTRIGPRFQSLEVGLASSYWSDFYTRALGMTETRITGPNDLHRIIATRGPVIAAIGSGDSAHSMVVAGYDILRGRWLVLDPAAGEELTFAEEEIVVGGSSSSPSSSSSGATLTGFRTGPATWENMSRWLWIFDTAIHERIFHY
jgi:LysM domain-containing protein/papain like cysteine protease AvrRpt2